MASSKLTAALEAEIRRCCRAELGDRVRELRAEIEGLAKSIRTLERRVGRGGTGGGRSTPASRRRRKKAPADPRLSPRSIKALRRRLELTQADLAELTQVSLVSIYFWEAGRTIPSGANAERLIGLTKLTPQQVDRKLERS